MCCSGEVTECAIIRCCLMHSESMDGLDFHHKVCANFFSAVTERHGSDSIWVLEQYRSDFPVHGAGLRITDVLIFRTAQLWKVVNHTIKPHSGK